MSRFAALLGPGAGQPDTAGRVQADLARRTKATPYVCPIPDDIGPPLTMSAG